ncbi:MULTISPECIES: glycosyltransferase family 4 protein [unclassified Arthrobacter]|uniref:glycosyltransferase family 4 protein n=1 Tax=unclassified Arthrobacter TaxID=235627 RepID=UPI002DFBBDB6|nr:MULTISPECIES: glycosyltransferase family 4 protein [unclassified Arthrobacter]MEC5193345.1 glycosyltransferase involved in cell wall biosynthesis [Arthrobacter sp. MP_M4]MEC5204811.1 glycosyltransferase involved in cell wall biosynthesis [Arthrobacter sp. MP_M7]
MSQLLTNLRLAAGVAAAHLTDDPIMLYQQLTRRLPAKLVQPLAVLVGRLAPSGSTAMPVLLAALARGDSGDVRRRLSLALTATPTPDRAGALSDIATAAHCPDFADQFLSTAAPTARLQRASARKLWHDGALTSAVAAADNSGRGSRLQRARLTAEVSVLQNWTPVLAKQTFVPVPGRVLHLLTNSLPHTASGYAQRSHSILRAQQDAGWEVLAATRIGYPVQVGKLFAKRVDVVDGVTYQRLLPAKLAATADARLQQQAEELLSLALVFKPSVLHTTTHFVNGLVVRAVAEALGIPWVYEVRGQLADTWASTRAPAARDSEKYRLFQHREAEVMRDANLVVTLGEAMKTNIMALGVSSDKILISPNAVGGRFLQEPADTATARRELGLAQAGLYIGTVSSLVDYEGLDDLISAFALLAPKHPQLRLLIVGDGASRPALEQQVRALGLSERALFTGRVPRALAPVYHQALDVFVVPRKDLDVTRAVTPLKPVEALASARPVVGSNLPALREIIDDGGNGILVPAEDPPELANALSTLLSDARRRKDMGREGRRTVVRERTWAANAELLAERYAGLHHEHEENS